MVPSSEWYCHLSDLVSGTVIWVIWWVVPSFEWSGERYRHLSGTFIWVIWWVVPSFEWYRHLSECCYFVTWHRIVRDRMDLFKEMIHHVCDAIHQNTHLRHEHLFLCSLQTSTLVKCLVALSRSKHAAGILLGLCRACPVHSFLWWSALPYIGVHYTAMCYNQCAAPPFTVLHRISLHFNVQ